MTIKQTIYFVCNTLNLNVDTLVCCNKCPQTQDYSEARMIITYLLRNQNKPVYYERIAFYLGRGINNNKGNHVITWRYYNVANDLIQTKDPIFTKKLQLVLDGLNSFVDGNTN